MLEIFILTKDDQNLILTKTLCNQSRFFSTGQKQENTFRTEPLKLIDKFLCIIFTIRSISIQSLQQTTVLPQKSLFEEVICSEMFSYSD